MTQTRLFLVTFISLCLLGYLVHFLFFRTASKPWEESGHFVLAFRTAPGPHEDFLLSFGIDDLKLLTENGKSETVTILSRRVTLNPNNSTLTLVLDTEVPTGGYSGFVFTLKSPELQNSWEEDTAPNAVTLAGETIHLSVPYTIAPNVTSAVILAFETQNVIKNRDGKHVFLPVVQIETRSNTTVTQTGDMIEVTGGTILHSATFGMDWDGTMRYNFRAKNVVSESKVTQKTTVPLPVESSPATSLDTSSTTKQLATSSADIASSSDSEIEILEETGSTTPY